jgi:CCR4-NOT transcriptional regulation complex NOT5 subunit
LNVKRVQIEDQSQGHQRDKLVASLKDQIKKLQKDRDKIKTWHVPSTAVAKRLRLR